MIIIGYPGVGKSTLAENYNPNNYKNGPKSVIDLESSLFDTKDYRDPTGSTIRKIPDWAVAYCNVAKTLSDQGHIVFVSAHEEVQRELREYMGPVGVICPAVELKQEWIQRLRNRYMCSSDVEKNKNFNAYERAVACYESDIQALKEQGFELIEITSLDYNLESLIFSDRI